MTSMGVGRHVALLPASQKGPGQHLATPGQGSWPLDEHDQRADVKQGAGGHDYVCNRNLRSFPSDFMLFLKEEGF